MRRTFLLLASLALGAAAASCHVDTSIGDHPCPPRGTTLTYDNFGRPFFTVNCVRCHGGPNGYSSRSFTTVEAIRSQADRIFINAAADNESMPPGPDGPPTEERERLADWLACGAP
jgi:hypothetical protein